MHRRKFIASIGALSGGCLLPMPAAAFMGKDLSPAKIVGVGGAGSNIVNSLETNRISGVTDYVLINTDKTSVDRRWATKKLIIGDGSWLPTKEALEQACTQRDEIAAAIGGTQLLIIVAGYGGVCGTHIAPMVARLGKELGSIVATIPILPFSYEGVRVTRAQAGLTLSMACDDITLPVSNEAICSTLAPETSMRDVFLIIDWVCQNAIRSVVRVAPGLSGGSQRQT